MGHSARAPVKYAIGGLSGARARHGVGPHPGLASSAGRAQTRQVRTAAYVTRRAAYRAAQLVATLLVVSTVLFAGLRLAVSPAELARVIGTHGLDGPLWEQYARFLGQALRFHFGDSLVHRTDALALVLQRLPATLALDLSSMALAVLGADLVGAWLGFRPHRPERRAALVAVLASQGIPSLLVGLVLIQLFAVGLRLLPGAGDREPPSLLLPAVTLAWFLAPRAIRATAASVDDAMRQRWVRTARAAGASSMELLWRHVLPNSLLGTLAALGAQFALLLSGSLVVESLFAWPGVGLLLVESVRAVDFPVVEASVSVVAGLVFVANLLLDLALLALDPRLRRRAA